MYRPLCPTTGWDGGLMKFLSKLVLNCGSLDLSFPISKDCRHEPLVPGFHDFYMSELDMSSVTREETIGVIILKLNINV
jgi:hypothetical protein